MAQLIYRDRHGATIIVKNPTREHIDAWAVEWSAIHGEAVRCEFIKQWIASGSCILNMMIRSIEFGHAGEPMVLVWFVDGAGRDRGFAAPVGACLGTALRGILARWRAHR